MPRVKRNLELWADASFDQSNNLYMTVDDSTALASAAIPVRALFMTSKNKAENESRIAADTTEFQEFFKLMCVEDDEADSRVDPFKTLLWQRWDPDTRIAVHSFSPIEQRRGKTEKGKESEYGWMHEDGWREPLIAIRRLVTITGCLSAMQGNDCAPCLSENAPSVTLRLVVFDTVSGKMYTQEGNDELQLPSNALFFNTWCTDLDQQVQIPVDATTGMFTVRYTSRYKLTFNFRLSSYAFSRMCHFGFAVEPCYIGDQYVKPQSFMYHAMTLYVPPVFCRTSWIHSTYDLMSWMPNTKRFARVLFTEKDGSALPRDCPCNNQNVSEFDAQGHTMTQQSYIDNRVMSENVELFEFYVDYIDETQRATRNTMRKIATEWAANSARLASVFPRPRDALFCKLARATILPRLRLQVDTTHMIHTRVKGFVDSVLQDIPFIGLRGIFRLVVRLVFEDGSPCMPSLLTGNGVHGLQLCIQLLNGPSANSHTQVISDVLVARMGVDKVPGDSEVIMCMGSAVRGNCRLHLNAPSVRLDVPSSKKSLFPKYFQGLCLRIQPTVSSCIEMSWNGSETDLSHISWSSPAFLCARSNVIEKSLATVRGLAMHFSPTKPDFESIQPPVFSSAEETPASDGTALDHTVQDETLDAASGDESHVQVGDGNGDDGSDDGSDDASDDASDDDDDGDGDGDGDNDE